MPDVFVPLEVEHGNETTAYIMQSGVVGHFVFEQLDKNRNLFKGVAFGGFVDRMNKTDLYFNLFQKYIFENGLDIKFNKNKAMVKRYINAEFARQLFGEEYYYQISLKEDTMIKTVLGKISNPKN